MPKIEHQSATVEKIWKLTPTVRTFRMRYTSGQGFSFKSGQFSMIEVPDGEKIKKKAYSIASSPFETEYVDLCVKLVEGGLATTWFWSLNEGDQVRLAGPYGKFVLPEPIENDLIFIATGTGIAPFRSMIRNVYHENPQYDGEIWLIFGVRYEDEILYDDEWKALAAQYPNFHYVPTISRPKEWSGEQGYVQEKLKKYISSPEGKQIYVCGLSPMVNAVQETALGMGFDDKQVHFEKYA